MILKAERITSWMKGKKQGPVRVELHPTNRCNAKCKFCWQITNNSNDYSYEMSDERLLEIIDEAAELGVKEWIISGGGEPLVRHDITMKIMDKIKRYNMWGQLTTNGALFKEDDIMHIADIGWDQIQFSIDGPDAKTHDYLRGSIGIFEKAISNLKFFADYKKQKKLSLPYLGFNTVLNRLNFNKLDKMIELASQVGSQLVYFEPLYPGYLSEERLELNKKEKNELSKYIKKAIRRAKELGISTNIDRFLDTNLIDKTHFNDTVIDHAPDSKNKFISAPCYQPWYLLGIKANGLAGCCSTFEDGEFIHSKTLEEVWFGDKFDKIRKNMLNKKIPDYCRKCSVVVVMDNNEIRKKLMSMPQGFLLSLGERIKKWMRR